MSTVGYGDINPESVQGKILAINVIMVVLVLLPAKSDQLMQLIKNHSKYRTRRYTKSVDQSHVMIAGEISLQAMTTFMRELFHPEHMQMKG